MEENLIGEAKEPVANYDLLSVIMLCLGGRDKTTYDGVIRMLDVLLSRDIAQTEKRNILESDYNIPMTQTMERGMAMTCNLSEGVWEEGWVEGNAAGEAKGKVEGITNSLSALMKNMDWTLDQAMAALSIPSSDREKYAELVGE